MVFRASMKKEKAYLYIGVVSGVGIFFGIGFALVSRVGALLEEGSAGMAFFVSFFIVIFPAIGGLIGYRLGKSIGRKMDEAAYAELERKRQEKEQLEREKAEMIAIIDEALEEMRPLNRRRGDKQ